MCTGIIHLVIEGAYDVSTQAGAACSYDFYTTLTQPFSALCAGNVVANSKFYQDESGNILNEICESSCWAGKPGTSE